MGDMGVLRNNLMMEGVLSTPEKPAAAHRRTSPSREAADTDPLAAILAVAEGMSEQQAAPVEQWSPDYCGDIGMEIRRDGTWWYGGTPFTRERLVRLFARILRKDADGHHYLVTPVEKIRVHVEIAPFLGVRVDRVEGRDGAAIVVETNVGDRFALGPDHRLKVVESPQGPQPLARVRGRLDALLTRPAFYELVGMATPLGDQLVVESRGMRFALGEVTA